MVVIVIVLVVVVVIVVVMVSDGDGGGDGDGDGGGDVNCNCTCQRGPLLVLGCAGILGVDKSARGGFKADSRSNPVGVSLAPLQVLAVLHRFPHLLSHRARTVFSFVICALVLLHKPVPIPKQRRTNSY